jgi:AcrR family transcriptional regulator
MEKLTKEELIKRFRTEGILEATRRVISSYGFEGITLERVAEEAGISKGTIYLYFENKEELLISTIEYGLDRLIERLEKCIDEEVDILKKVKNIISTKLSYIESHREFVRAFIAEMYGQILVSDEDKVMRIKNKRDYLYKILTDVIKSGIDSGIFRNIDPYKGAFSLVELIKGIGIKRVVDRSEENIDNDITFIMDIFLQGIAKKGV